MSEGFSCAFQCARGRNLRRQVFVDTEEEKTVTASQRVMTCSKMEEVEEKGVR